VIDLSNPTPTSADATLLARQAHDIAACLDRLLPTDRPVALLQFPFDFNVGNHMMWVATCDYLQRRGIRIAYAAHGSNFSIEDMMRAVGDGAVLFIGGVTISRLWPRHAEVKRIVAAACPGNRLISLPSTMLFVDDDDRREAGSIFGDHRDVILMARDPVSGESARGAFPDHVSVLTMHDSTFLLPPQPRTAPPRHDIIWLARDDKEGAGLVVPPDVHVFDWPRRDLKGYQLLFSSRIFSRLRAASPMLGSVLNPRISACYDRVSRYVLESGNRQLDAGKVLITDRLHPHILAALRSQPCVLLPDRFGKNRAVYDYSSRSYSTVHWADTPQEALERARALASEP
jgi:pyruvyl transferase EpsO